MESYIKNDHVGFNFGFEFYNGKQLFKNRWTYQIFEEEVAKMRAANLITDDDLKIVRFIFKYKIATASIIRDLINPEASIATAKGWLEKLLKNRFLNKFMISAFPTDEYKDDALDFYCLDIGGKKLLSHYGDATDEIEKWNTSVPMMSVSKITEALVSADFYVQLQKNCGGNLLYMKSNPQYRKVKEPVSANFEFAIRKNVSKKDSEPSYETKYFICVIVREANLLPDFQDTIARVDDLVTSNAWKRYFYDEQSNPPVVIVLAENDNVALSAAKIVDNRTSIKAIRYTTDDRIHNDMSGKASFMKFVAANEDEKHPEPHLAFVKTSVFSKD